LIQSELPSISSGSGDNKIPNVTFGPMEPPDDKIKPNKGTTEDEDVEGCLGRSTKDALGDGGVGSYSGAGREGTG
jgi:hypothetical protein